MADIPSYDEKELLSRIANGDEAAFEILFHRYLPRLTPFAWKLTQNWEVAREIVQETFLRIWLSRDQLAQIESPSAWIFTIASNQCYKYLRRKMLHDRLPSTTGQIVDPDATINLQELKRLIDKAVGALSEQRRKIFILSREKGMTIPEIAREMDLSPNTIKNTLVSALRSIREYLEAQGYLLPVILLVSILKK